VRLLLPRPGCVRPIPFLRLQRPASAPAASPRNPSTARRREAAPAYGGAAPAAPTAGRGTTTTAPPRARDTHRTSGPTPPPPAPRPRASRRPGRVGIRLRRSSRLPPCPQDRLARAAPSRRRRRRRPGREVADGVILGAPLPTAVPGCGSEALHPAAADGGLLQ